jgi:tRNA (cmo5U34)-methyltransferase
MSTEQTDRTRPEGRWAFDAEVTRVFDDMLARSIPQYEVMRQACFDLGAAAFRPQTTVVDLGCSRGEALAPFIDRFGAQGRYVGVEVSEPMLAAARERYGGLIDCGVVEIRRHDLRAGFPAVAPAPSVTLCVLTLQFVPIEYRQRLLRQCYRATTPGGCLILVEKVLGESADLDAEMVRVYYDLKRLNGYSGDDIERKRLALEGVLVPVTAAWNQELVRRAGFAEVDCFWRWMNFAGWVAAKE